MKTKNKVFRQGDVLIIPTQTIPTHLVKTKKVCAALGEVTGHHHSIAGGCVGYAVQEEQLVSYIEVTEDVAHLTHQEHSTIDIPKGKYKVVKQVEFTPKGIKNVQD